VGAGDWPTEPELHAFCRDHLAAYKTPATWIFVDAFLPVASGKVRKNVLHERHPGRVPPPPVGRSRRPCRGRSAYTDSISRAASCCTACTLLVDHTAPPRQ
jgi:hypothetical protein